MLQPVLLNLSPTAPCRHRHFNLEYQLAFAIRATCSPRLCQLANILL